MKSTSLSQTAHFMEHANPTTCYFFPLSVSFLSLEILALFSSIHSLQGSNYKPQQWSWSWPIQACCSNPSSISSCCHVCLGLVLNTKSKPSFSSSPPSLPLIFPCTPWIHGTPVVAVVYGITSLAVPLQLQIQLQVL